MTKQPHQRLLSTYYVLSHFIAVWPWAILLYKFPVAAVTNDHKLASFKQRKFILPQSGGQKSEMCILGPKSRSQQCCTCWEGPRGEFVPCLFWFLMAPDVPDLWLHNSGLCLCLHVVFSSVYVKSLSVSFFFSFFFWPHHTVCGIFPDQGSPVPHCSGNTSPSHWTPREVPCFFLIRRALMMAFRAHQIIQDDFSISTLNHIRKDPFSKSGHTDRLRG